MSYMMGKRSCVLLLIIGVFIFFLYGIHRNVKHIQSAGEIEQLFAATNTIYTIDTIVNLNDARVYIPDSCELHFLNGGGIYNGTIVGCNTRITGRQSGIFNEIVIEGSWLVENISTSMYVKIDENTLRNLSVMCSEKHHNCIKIEDNCLVPIIHFSSVFNIPSNTDVVLNADIHTIPTKYKGGYALQVNGSNIHINGNGHKIIGTIEQDKSNNQQWQHGIFVTRNSSNVLIENIKCTKFWGDGFYVMGNNIKIKGVESSYNGRQGLSLTHGHNILIEKSSFHHTGSIEICSCKGPGAGIDIEPNEGDTVKNIMVQDCNLYENYKYMHGYTNDFQVYNAPYAAVTVRNCCLGGAYLGKMSHILFDNCNITESLFGIDKAVSNVTIKKSRIPNISQIKINNITIEQ